jgi:hypothetical protein
MPACAWSSAAAGAGRRSPISRRASSRAGFASVNDARTAVAPTLNQYSVPATGIGARFEIAPPIGSGVTLRLGSDLRRVSGRPRNCSPIVAGSPDPAPRGAGGESLTLGGFADASYESGPLTLNAGRPARSLGRSPTARCASARSAPGPLTDSRFPDRMAGKPPAAPALRIGSAGDAARRSLSRLAAADAQRAVSPFPRRRRCDRRQCRARSRAADRRRDRRSTGARHLRSRCAPPAIGTASTNAIANVTLARDRVLFPASASSRRRASIASARISTRSRPRASNSTAAGPPATSALPHPMPSPIRASPPRVCGIARRPAPGPDRARTRPAPRWLAPRRCRRFAHRALCRPAVRGRPEQPHARAPSPSTPPPRCRSAAASRSRPAPRISSMPRFRRGSAGRV